MRISIVTPTLNAVDFIPDLIASIQQEASAEADFEHLIVDGGSTDGTVELAQKEGCVVLQGKDRGIFDAIDKGTRAATGDVVNFLGGDDTLLPGAGEVVARWFKSRTSDWSVGGIRWIDLEGRSLGDIAAPPANLALQVYMSLTWNCIHHQSVYMTPDFYARVGGFNADFKYVGDYDFFARALHDSQFDRLSESTATFRRHANNASTSGDPRIASEYNAIVDREGPPPGLRRDLYRQGLRLWTNGRNPSWFLHKMVPGVARRVLPS